MPPFATTRRVEFGDTDLAGIMYFANFFRFMEVAETDFLRGRGLSVSWTAGGVRYGFPRVSAACDYLRPVRFEDVLSIAVAVEKVGRTSIAFRHDFSHGEVAVAVGRMTTVYCRESGGGADPHGIESLVIPPDIRAKLEA